MKRKAVYLITAILALLGLFFLLSGEGLDPGNAMRAIASAAIRAF